MCSLEKIWCVSDHRMDQSISILAEAGTVSAFVAVVFSVFCFFWKYVSVANRDLFNF